MGLLDYVIHRTNEGRERMRQQLLAGEIPHWIKSNRRATYIAAVVRSVPPWVDREELRRIKERTQALTEITGVQHHISHKVPLNNPRVCGLTVPWNLEPKPWFVNQAESNHFQLEEQRRLFDDETA